MSNLVLLVGGLSALAFVGALVVSVWVFLRVTAGAQGLKARVQRLFLLPVRVRPLPRGHYFKAYWRGRGE